ncbi:Ca-activated chloride channel family protein [Chitinophaga sp. YR573]|uniref:YfbK domain-containing protein n=1 Tax=Chitinophaga sp. YR573 TaxID=1881040 RepID=UPI0008C95202|nr:von Willebrand factor type A domain-containing protein [Chitinophaga sp. YR573]SEV98082.1 Ca-activated chloride channel family protein [Chitinophaga sp. YR573]
MQRLFLLLVSLIFLVPAIAQKIWITGAVEDSISHNPLPGVTVEVINDTAKVTTNQYGLFRIPVPSRDAVLLFRHNKYRPKQVAVGSYDRMLVDMDVQDGTEDPISKAKAIARERSSNSSNPNYGNSGMGIRAFFDETYGILYENKFIQTANKTTSAFAVDVDRAAYSNIRRFVRLKERIPVDAVRIEEMVNYFQYHYPLPPPGEKLAIYSSYASCPWEPAHQLLQIAVRSAAVNIDSLPPSNLVFLIDASGSMGTPNKLPLLQAAFRILVNNLRKNDHVAIVAYAGTPGVVLPSTPGNQKEKILNAIDYLSAGGATAGEAAIKLAYQIAGENFIQGGNNRVIMATDGDFNVGQTSDQDMEQLILGKKETGVLLTCLGFGMKDYKDSKLETLSSKGNGNFAYIDNLEEASKIFAREFGSTLFTVAKDVRADVTFNPTRVKAYRLIGYENKVIKDEATSGDKICGGIIGPGHCAVAIYEVIPQPGTDIVPKAGTDQTITEGQLAEITLHYKEVDTVSHTVNYEVPGKLISFTDASSDFRFSSAVALLGMLLRKSAYKGNGNSKMVQDIAKRSLGDDPGDYRKEFLKLVKEMKKSGHLED